MNVEKVVQRQPRTELDNIAEDIGMDPSSYPNKEELAEKMTRFMEENISHNDVVYNLKKARSIIHKTREKENIDNTYLEEKLKKMNSIKDSGGIVALYCWTEEIIQEGRSLLELNNEIEDLKAEIDDEAHEDKVKTIKRRHTRKEMNSMAEEMGIDGPTTYRNKTKLANAMIENFGDEGLEDELTEKEERIKSLLKEARDNKIVDLSKFKEEFSDMQEAREEGSIQKALDMAEDLVEEGETILRLNEKVKKVIDDIKKMKKQDIKEEYYSKLKDLIAECKEGNYLDKLDDIEEIKEEIEWYNESEEELKKKLNDAKKRLLKLRETRVDVNLIKELVNEAIGAKEEKNFDKALKKVEKVLEKSELAVELSNKIQECGDKIKELRKGGSEFDNYLDQFKMGKKKASQGEYEVANQIIGDTLTEIEEDMRHELEEETEEEPVEEEEQEETSPPGPTVNREKIEDLCDRVEDIEEEIKELKEDLTSLLEIADDIEE